MDKAKTTPSDGNNTGAAVNIDATAAAQLIGMGQSGNITNPAVGTQGKQGTSGAVSEKVAGIHTGQCTASSALTGDPGGAQSGKAGQGRFRFQQWRYTLGDRGVDAGGVGRDGR
jgi:hypothetical protein